MTQFEARYEAGTLSASQNALRVLKPTVLAVAMGCVGSAWAADGGVVVNGTGRIATQGATTTVTQSTDKMVVNWNNFDIAQGQTVNFAQPNASSAVLNRVVGPVKATDIQGTLNANGRVYVVNPAGVMFGQNAVVNADSVVASTLDIGAQQFMAGGRAAGNQKLLDLSAGSTKGSIVNQGRINARRVALLGGRVLNKGQINATGDVTLGSAQTATLSLDNSGFSVALGAPELNALVDNGGMIVAKGGNVRLTAAATGDALRNAVRNTGTIEARRATTGAGGSIELRSDADGQISFGGKLTADDRINIEARPGTATSKGRTIVVEPTAQLQASDIAINAVGSTLTTNGSYTANTVTLAGDNVVVNVPVVSARDVNVYGANSVTQKANITGTGRVSINGNTIEQAAGVTTRGGAIELIANQATGSVKAATLDGEQVRIAGKTVALNEDVKGKYGIDVAAGRGGNITAAKSLTSDAGSVNLDAVGAKVVTRGAVNFTGTAGDRKLTGVENGEVSDKSHDAVNGSQLYTVAQSVADAMGGGSTVNEDGSVTTPVYNVTNVDGTTTTVNGVEGAVNNLDQRTYSNTTKIENITNQINNGGIGLVQQAAPGADLTVGKGTDGKAVNFTGTDGDRVLTGVAAGSADNDAVNIKQLKDAGVINKDGSANAVVTYDNAEKTSITMGGEGASTPVAIHNVADGVADHDAVNISQLNQRLQSNNTEVLNQANSYTDQRINDVWQDLGDEINQVNRQANRGIAAASALVNVTPYLPGKTAVNAGVASYRGEAALGVGVSRWSDNGRVNFNAGVSAAKGDEPVFRVGVGYVF